MAKRFCIETYGCQMNLADSELISGLLTDHGWEATAAAGDADLIIVNTCSVRERATERVIGHVQSMHPLRRNRPGLRIVLAGCLPQHRGRVLAEQLPEVDIFIGPDNYRDLPALLAEPGRRPRFSLRPNRRETYDGLRPRRDGRGNAWVSVMRGCNRMCTYCAVPFARGRERSLPAGRVVQEVKDAVAAGFSAVTLLGQTVTSYRDGETGFADLLARVSAISGVRRVRFLSPHPADFDSGLLRVIGTRPRIARHLHLPLQSGSTRILEAMRRGYTRSSYRALVEEARALIPGLAVTTDIIVGFPGETEDDYRQTLDLMRSIRFDSAFLFAYSPRQRTYAERFLADDVPEPVKKQRLTEIIRLQEEHAWQRFRAFEGRRIPVLVEGSAKGESGCLFGRAPDDKATLFAPLPGAAPPLGHEVWVEIEEVSSHTLKGRQLPSP